MACMAYVDLNPIWAKQAETPETSDHTALQRRALAARNAHRPNRTDQQAKDLMPFTGNPREDRLPGLPFHLTDYLELVDCTGRIVREDKRGHIPEEVPAILERLNIDPQH